MKAENAPDFTLESSSARIPERGVIWLDAGGVIRHANGRMQELLGVEARELIGKDYVEACEQHLAPKAANGEAFVERVEAVSRNCPDTVEDVVPLVHDGQEITLHRYSSPMLDADGKLAGRVEVYSDITIRRRFEQEILDRTNELAVLNVELQRAQQKLVHAARLAALGEMSAGVAHHLNNVLGVILGNVQLAQRRELDPWVREKLETCELAATDGANKVQRIRALAKSEECLVVEPIDLNEIVREVLKLTEPQLAGIELVTELGEVPTIEGSATDLREVLANIVLNAAQAMPDGGSITIRTYQQRDSVVASVADTGAGMTDEVKFRIFDPFFTTRGSEGTGLGLSIADAIVSQHGGDISVVSELGKGTEISIRLPISEAVTAAAANNNG